MALNHCCQKAKGQFDYPVASLENDSALYRMHDPFGSQRH